MSKNNAKPQSTPSANRQKRRSAGKNPAVSVLFSAFAGIAAFFAAVFVLSFIIEKSPDPNALLPACAVISAALSACVAGTVAAKTAGKVAPWSILSGLLMLIVFLFISLFFDSADHENGMIFKSIVVAILPTMAYIAGTVTSKKKGKVHRQKRR
ncbi:MAG: TIGR04086 family membrane protein [Clostridia bacterium]|nr:TIGR04086 family membrane protein [Clostridia bacterium]